MVVADLRNTLPLTEHLPAMLDARARFLAPGGTLIPRRDVLCAAVVAAEEAYDLHRRPWRDGAPDLDMSGRGADPLHAAPGAPARERAADAGAELGGDRLSVVSSPRVAGRATWTSGRAGMGRGLLIWFDTELVEGVGFSNGPAAPEAILYFLEEAPPAGNGATAPVQIRPMRTRETLVAAFAQEFRLARVDVPSLQPGLDRLAGSSALRRCRQMAYHRRIGDLPAVVEAIRRDLHAPAALPVPPPVA